MLTIDGSTIILSGFVGGNARGGDADFWSFEPDGFKAGDVIQALAEIGHDQDVTIRLNSPGGVASEGAAIHAAIMQHGGDVRVIVEGVAASAASLLAMAAGERVMAPGSYLMIHDPATFTVGTVEDHERSVRMLNAMATSYAGIYARASGMTAAKARQVMQAETWYTPEDAVKAGFATSILAENDNEPVEAVAFAYQIYAHAPTPLVALAQARGIRPPAHMTAPAVAAKEPRMATKKDKAAETPAEPLKPGDPGYGQPANPAEQTPEPRVPVPVADPPEDQPKEQPQPNKQNPDDEAGVQMRAETARCSAIATMCAEKGVPGMAANLIATGATLAQATAKVTEAGDIRTIVANAARTCRAVTMADADRYIAEGMSKAQVSDILLAKLTGTQSPELSAQAPAPAAGAPAPGATRAPGLNPANIYANMSAGKAGLSTPAQ